MFNSVQRSIECLNRTLGHVKWIKKFFHSVWLDIVVVVKLHQREKQLPFHESFDYYSMVDLFSIVCQYSMFVYNNSSRCSLLWSFTTVLSDVDIYSRRKLYILSYLLFMWKSENIVTSLDNYFLGSKHQVLFSWS
jgi:hypothetical protein